MTLREAPDYECLILPGSFTASVSEGPAKPAIDVEEVMAGFNLWLAGQGLPAEVARRYRAHAVRYLH